jgi:hypothetical protein
MGVPLDMKNYSGAYPCKKGLGTLPYRQTDRHKVTFLSTFHRYRNYKITTTKHCRKKLQKERVNWLHSLKKLGAVRPQSASSQKESCH